MRYPFADLANAMGLSENAACRALNVSGSTQQDYRSRGLSERVADRLAVKAGLHPFEVWPDMIAEANAECAECGASFVPTRKGHVYCGGNCSRRRLARIKYQSDPEHRERHLEGVRVYRAESRRARLLKQRVKYEQNADLMREKRRERYARNRDAEMARQAAYRARRRAA